MFSKRILYFSALLFAVFFSCGKKPSDGTMPTRWGKENCFEKFLWKKHIPDTLYRTLEFDFNQDAKKYMSKPLRLGLFKKDDSGKMLQVPDTEMEVFVKGKKCPNNIIDVEPDTEQLKVGIVFNPKAENKVHHWFFRAIDDGGLERINDMDADSYNTEGASLLNIDAEKHKIMNPLAEGLALAGIVLAIALLVWLLVLKYMFFPLFRVGKIQFTDPVPYNSLKRLRGCRKLIITNKKNIREQSFLNRFFTGKILYELNDIWTNELTVEPKDKNSVRLRYPKDYLADARVLKKHQEYTIQNISTGTKTKIKIS